MENCNCIEKTINDNDSKRITILRFILIFFVIVLHNFFSVENILQYNSDYKENIFVYFIRYLITEYNKPKIWTKNSKNSEFAVL